MALSTTWTARDAVSFTAGTLASISDIRTQVEGNLQRGTLSATTTPSTTQLDTWTIRGKQELSEQYGFAWRRAFVYADTEAGVYRYALPADFGNGALILRNITSNKRIDYYDTVGFDMEFIDPAGEANAEPKSYTVKDRELWFSVPADGVYRIELEYPRTGDDTTANDVSYIPELMRFKLVDYTTYKAFLLLQQWEAASGYKSEWLGGVQQGKKGDARKKWAQMGYQAFNWFYKK